MSKESLERAAAKHDARDAKKQAVERAKVPSARALRAMTREVQDESLGGSGSGPGVVDLLLAAVGIVAAFQVVRRFVPIDSDSNGAGLLFAGIMIPLAVLAVAALWIGKRRLMAGLRRKRIREIGYGFNADAYLLQMGEKRDYGTLTIRLRFSAPWPEGERDVAANALAGWVEKLHPGTWSDDGTLLTARSEEISCKGSAISSYGSSRWFTNRDLHAVFSAVVARLPELHEVVPIQRLEVSVGGYVHPPDASADL